MENDILLINQKIGEAHYKIANRFYTGSGVEQDYHMALRHYKFAAETGNLPSQNNLGAMYLSGEGTLSSISNAQKYFKIAADNGSLQSQFNLARLYLKENSTRYSKLQAIKYLKMSANKSYIPSINLLASIYQYGNIATPQDLPQAIKLYKIASSKNSSSAQNELGVIYSTLLITVNYHQAIKYFTLSSLAGFVPAKYNLATMYQNSEGVKRNLRKAFQLYLDAADDGHTNAMYNLAIMHKDGSGVEKNMSMSIYWFKKGAFVEDVGSMYNLGMIYRYGVDDIPIDLTLARYWFVKASKLFCGPAISEIKEMDKDNIRGSDNLIYVDFN